MKCICGTVFHLNLIGALAFNLWLMIETSPSQGVLVQGFGLPPATWKIPKTPFEAPRFLALSMKAATETKTTTIDEVNEFPTNSENIIPQMKEKMQKTSLSLRKNLSLIYVGRASPDLLSRVKVRAYGVVTPISQLSTISTVGLLSLTVEPYDSSLTKSILRAIVDDNLGLSPTFDGTTIFMDVPPMNEELRISMGKKCKEMGEDGKVSIRNLRRVYLNEIKDMGKKGFLSQDEEKTMQKQVQNATDEYIKKIEDLVKQKEAEVMKF